MHTFAPTETELKSFDIFLWSGQLLPCLYPITLIAMCSGGNHIWGWTIFAFVWICAIVGTALSFRKMKTHSYLETVCYVLMGLSIMIAVWKVLQ